MWKLIWIAGLWLVGISPVLALSLETPEALKYNVYWGFVRVGGAQLSYLPGAAGEYTLRAVVKDDSSLIDLHDVWESRGVHTAKRAFVPQLYSVKQAENSYRADKTMVFDAKAKKVVFTNKLDAADKAEPLVLSEARDVLATLYAWRLSGVTDIGHEVATPMVSLKTQLTLKRSKGEKTSIKVGNRDYAVWRVQLQVLKDNGKPSKDSWTVYVSQDADMKPVQIVASTKFGTFRASLSE